MNGLNWYAYCGNAPINRCDSSGNSWEDIKNWFTKAGKGVKDGFFMFCENTVYSIAHPIQTVKGFFDPKQIALRAIDPFGVGRNFYTIGSSIRNNDPYALGKFAGGKAGELTFVLVTKGVAKRVGKAKISIKSKGVSRAKSLLKSKVKGASGAKKWNRNIKNTSDLNTKQFKNLKDNGVIKVNSWGSNRPLSNPNSYYKTANEEHIFVYNSDGKLIYDISAKRVKGFEFHTNPKTRNEFYKDVKLSGGISDVIRKMFNGIIENEIFDEFVEQKGYDMYSHACNGRIIEDYLAIANILCPDIIEIDKRKIIVEIGNEIMGEIGLSISMYEIEEEVL